MFHTKEELEIVKLPNAEEKEKGFRHVFSKFADKTSMVGVPYIDVARFWWAKLIWTFLLLAAVAAMSLHLWYLFSQWYSWPKTTKLSLGFSHLSIPQITVCNINALHRSRFQSYTEAKELKQVIDLVRLKNSGPQQKVSTLNEELSTTDIPLDNVDTTLIRKRRFLQGYNMSTNFSDVWFNIFGNNSYEYEDYSDNSQDDYQNNNDEDDFGTGTFYYGAEVSNETKIKERFTNLYMDINMTDRERLGHQIGDMLMDCTFNGRVCNASLFKLHQTSSFRNCWTISSKEFTVTKTGPKGGLSLVLFLENNEYIREITHGYGVRIDVKQRNTYPFPTEEGMFIPAAMETDIGLRMLRVERLGGNYGKCNTGVEFKQLYDFTYTRQACQTVCLITEVINQCGCYSGFEELSLKIDASLTPCRTREDLDCIKTVQHNFTFDELTCECENPCKEIAYTKSVSQRQWPTYEDASVALTRVCERDPNYCVRLQDEQSNKSLRELKPVYPGRKLGVVKLWTKWILVALSSFQQLLSDVGGAIGLWIGLSILSLCELLQLAVELLHYAAYKTVLKNRGNKSRLEQTADERQEKRNFFSRLHRGTKVQMINS